MRSVLGVFLVLVRLERGVLAHRAGRRRSVFMIAAWLLESVAVRQTRLPLRVTEARAYPRFSWGEYATSASRPTSESRHVGERSPAR